MTRRSAPIFLLLLSGGLVAATGCRSRFIETSIVNESARPVHLLEVDYPSASFGKQLLEAHSQYHYRFKVQGSGPAKLEFTDEQGGVHTSTGPQLDEGEEGALSATINSEYQVTWSPQLRSTR